MPGGIGRHNAYEIDSSLTRNDKYFGDNFSMNGTLYEAMFKVADKVNGGALNVSIDLIHRQDLASDTLFFPRLDSISSRVPQQPVLRVQGYQPRVPIRPHRRALLRCRPLPMAHALLHRRVR